MKLGEGALREHTYNLYQVVSVITNNGLVGLLGVFFLAAALPPPLTVQLGPAAKGRGKGAAQMKIMPGESLAHFNRCVAFDYHLSSMLISDCM